MRKTKTLDGFQFQHIDFEAIIEAGEPCIFKGALNECPLVIEAKQSDEAAMTHLQSFYSQRPLLCYSAEGEANTKFFYNQTMDGFNYDVDRVSLNEFFDNINRAKSEGAGSSFYIGSADLEAYFPKLLRSNRLSLKGDVFAEASALIGIWLGNKTTAATHYDISNNIAACVVGKRRFTLFPPGQIGNLYPGPLEPTPGGQVVSMVDLNKPDLQRFPRFSDALEHAEVAELESGDVLVYPAMWWHQVEALADFNVLINYWWNSVPSFVDDPSHTLMHGLLSLRDRPKNEKDAWKALFDFYVFGDAKEPRAHLPEKAWGALGDFDKVSARRHRSKLLNKFNR